MWTEFDSEHDAAEYERLRRFVSRKGRAFGLAIATYEDPTFALELRQRASAELRDFEIATVSLADGGEDLFALIEAAGAEHDAVFVTGLDSIITDLDGGRADTRAVVNLNLQRDELPLRVGARVILWLSIDAFAQFAELAWDLVEVVFTRFEFRHELSEQSSESATLAGWPRWMSLPEGAAREDVREQAASLAQIASEERSALTRADAAASAGRLYAEIGEFDRSAELLELAARHYQRAARGSDTTTLLAAATQLRRRAWVTLANGDEPGALRCADEAVSLLERALDRAEPATKRVAEAEWRRSSIELAELRGRIDVSLENEEDVSDEELLRGWRAGDRRAGDRLVARKFERVRDAVGRMIPASEVEDVIQGVFLTLARSRADVANVDGFLRAVTMNMVNRYYAAMQKQTARGVAVEFDELAALEPSAVELLIDDEQLAVMRDAMRGLGARDRELLELRYFHDLPNRQIGAMLGISMSAVASRLSRARQTLGEQVRRLASARGLGEDAELNVEAQLGRMKTALFRDL